MPKHQGCGFESDETHLECQLQGECVTYTFFIKMFSTFPYCFNGSWSWLYSMIRWLVESCGVIDEPEPIWPKPTGSDGTLCTLLYRRLFSLSLLISPPSYKGDAILDISLLKVLCHEKFWSLPFTVTIIWALWFLTKKTSFGKIFKDIA